jgi:hypothetical protein
MQARYETRLSCSPALYAGSWLDQVPHPALYQHLEGRTNSQFPLVPGPRSDPVPTTGRDEVASPSPPQMRPPTPLSRSCRIASNLRLLSRGSTVSHVPLLIWWLVSIAPWREHSQMRPDSPCKHPLSRSCRTACNLWLPSGRSTASCLPLLVCWLDSIPPWREHSQMRPDAPARMPSPLSRIRQVGPLHPSCDTRETVIQSEARCSCTPRRRHVLDYLWICMEQ